MAAEMRMTQARHKCKFLQMQFVNLTHLLKRQKYAHLTFHFSCEGRIIVKAN